MKNGDLQQSKLAGDFFAGIGGHLFFHGVNSDTAQIQTVCVKTGIYGNVASLPLGGMEAASLAEFFQPFRVQLEPFFGDAPVWKAQKLPYVVAFSVLEKMNTVSIIVW